MEYLTKRRLAITALAELLQRPLAIDNESQSSDDFDPWEMFPCVYGSYSSEFDNMALRVLDNLILTTQNRWDSQRPEELAHEMFREILCTTELCEYGTSPRTCFPTAEFAKLLPRYAQRWREYYQMQWGEEPPAPPA